MEKLISVGVLFHGNTNFPFRKCLNSGGKTPQYFFKYVLSMVLTICRFLLRLMQMTLKEKDFFGVSMSVLYLIIFKQSMIHYDEVL